MPSALAVTPFVGVWIEMKKRVFRAFSNCVTPFVGVWIEIVTGTWNGAAH